jgi:5-methylcytosine-specific restriction endonuclease McrA
MARARRYVSHRHPGETWGPEMMPATAKQQLTARLARLQGGLCALCGTPLILSARFGSRKGRSIEHVWPRNRAGPLGERKPPLGNFGNKVAAHGHCNATKGDRAPTGCELIWLMAVNARRLRPADDRGAWR